MNCSCCEVVELTKEEFDLLSVELGIECLDTCDISTLDIINAGAYINARIDAKRHDEAIVKRAIAFRVLTQHTYNPEKEQGIIDKMTNDYLRAHCLQSTKW